MSDALSLLTVQFLAWVAERPRSYTETMEAWRTSCPRLPVWEDATSEGLVQRQSGNLVVLTARGRAALEAGSGGPSASAETALQILTRTV
jgi:hypothetical protein